MQKQVVGAREMNEHIKKGCLNLLFLRQPLLYFIALIRQCYRITANFAL